MQAPFFLVTQWMLYLRFTYFLSDRSLIQQILDVESSYGYDKQSFLDLLQRYAEELVFCWLRFLTSGRNETVGFGFR